METILRLYLTARSGALRRSLQGCLPLQCAVYFAEWHFGVWRKTLFNKTFLKKKNLTLLMLTKLHILGFLNRQTYNRAIDTTLAAYVK